GKAHLAVVGRQLTSHHPQQGGLAGTVAADQGNALARADRQAHLFEQQRSADADVDAFKGDQGHGSILPGHGRASPSWFCQGTLAPIGAQDPRAPARCPAANARSSRPWPFPPSATIPRSACLPTPAPTASCTATRSGTLPPRTACRCRPCSRPTPTC